MSIQDSNLEVAVQIRPTRSDFKTIIRGFTVVTTEKVSRKGGGLRTIIILSRPGWHHKFSFGIKKAMLLLEHVEDIQNYVDEYKHEDDVA